MPEPLRIILFLSLLNPMVLAVGALLGRRADQPQKLVVAGFVAAIAGCAFAWVLMRLGATRPAYNLLAGAFIASVAVGTAAAWVGWRLARR